MAFTVWDVQEGLADQVRLHRVPKKARPLRGPQEEGDEMSTTKTPWELEILNTFSYGIVPGCDQSRSLGQLPRRKGGGGEEEANARYIVAAVNACKEAGITVEALEGGIIKQVARDIQDTAAAIERCKESAL